ncbi:hypothetical protein ACKKBG_A24375 [Auxenochlorella protothecoides x Auxenochlorella symbiontica]
MECTRLFRTVKLSKCSMQALRTPTTCQAVRVWEVGITLTLLQHKRAPRKTSGQGRVSAVLPMSGLSTRDEDCAETAVMEAGDGGDPTSDIVLEQVTYEAGVYKAVGSFLTAASPPTVYDLLTDYPTLPRIFTSIAECREEAGREGDSLLRQTCLWEFLGFSGQFDSLLRVSEDPAMHRVSFSLVPGQSGFLADLTGTWSVQAAPGDAGLTRTQYSLAVHLASKPPHAIGSLAKAIFASQVKAMLSDLQQAVGR